LLGFREARPSQTWGCYMGCLSRRMRRAG
jgi:hypothetical protein